MNVDRCPLEIWTFIFSLACTDGGFTGRSLSLVSKSFREASIPVKLQCISVIGPTQISSFASLLKQIPTSHRLIRSLFISTLKLHQNSSESELVNDRDDDGDGGDDDDSNSGYEFGESEENLDEKLDNDVLEWYQLKDNVHDILQTVAPHVTILDLHTSYSRDFFLPPVWLPQIVDLSLYGSVLEDYDDWQTYSMSKPFTTLRCLRLGYFDSFSSELFVRIKIMAPNINELHLPCHPALTRERRLEVALGICEPRPSDFVNLRGGGVAVPTLPLSVKKVYVQMDWRPAPWVKQNVDEFERVQREDTSGRLAFVESRAFGSFSIDELDWWERMVVHKGWLERNEAFNFRSKSIPL